MYDEAIFSQEPHTIRERQKNLGRAPVKKGRRKHTFSCWKREVKTIIRGILPIADAAKTIERIADDSIVEEEISRRTHNAAYEWADSIRWGVRPEKAYA